MPPDVCFQKLQYCNCNAKMIYGNCYLLSVICNTKNSFSETVNCQTVTLAIDIGVVQETGTVLAKPIFPFQKL